MARTPGGNAAIAQQLAGATGLDGPDAHALAGFIDAEGCFKISPNNGGRNWQCAMELAQRLDNGDALVDLQRCTGLGRVSTKAGRGRSRPQAVWRITSKRECLELARLLERFPLRARKRRDFDIWARAVERWSAVAYDTRADPAVHAQMAHDAAAIRQSRRYVNSPPPALDGAREALLAYLGGFFSGEGCFGLSGLQPRAVIKLRRDDRAILELFVKHFGLGLVRDRAGYGGDHPQVTWTICAVGELAGAVGLLEAAQLRGAKRREFEVWREAARERASARLTGRHWNRARVERVAERLTALRPYRQPSQPVASDPGQTAREARQAYVHVLRAFASEVPDGELTCTAYAQARAGHPQWPSRNTIALAFGSWARALRAAGLGARVSSWTTARNAA